MRTTLLLTIAIGVLIQCSPCVAQGDGPLLPTVLIRGATFAMGTPIRQKWRPDYHEDETLLVVTVRDFKIGKYPITAAQMCEFLNSPEAIDHDRESLYNHRDLVYADDYAYSTIELSTHENYVPRQDAAQAPANQVTWKGAVLYCDWLSKKTGNTYRLPSEAEWELAARGQELRPWPWGSRSPSAKMGERYNHEYGHNDQELDDLRKANLPTWPTTPVGNHPKNATPEGVHDLLAYINGEWCAGKYHARLTPELAVSIEADLADLVTERVVRGILHRANEGLWFMAVRYHAGRSWTRDSAHPIDSVTHAAWYGFRVAQNVAK